MIIVRQFQAEQIIRELADGCAAGNSGIAVNDKRELFFVFMDLKEELDDLIRLLIRDRFYLIALETTINIIKHQLNPVEPKKMIDLWLNVIIAVDGNEGVSFLSRIFRAGIKVDFIEVRHTDVENSFDH